MRLGLRLKCVASMVPAGSKIADIGTDHAYLPVWLLQQGVAKAAIASDVAAGPCEAARATINSHGLAGTIDVRQGDGLLAIGEGEADTVIIAGMGGALMIDILRNGQKALLSVCNLILQPMAESARLRRWLCENGWRIDREELVLEAGRLYEVILFKKGISAAHSEIEYEIGPCLLQGSHPLLPLHIKNLIDRYRFVSLSMEKSAKAAQSEKYQKNQMMLVELEGVLQCL